MQPFKILLSTLVVWGCAYGDLMDAFFSARPNRTQTMPTIQGSCRLEPQNIIVGMPCYFVFSFKSDSSIIPQRIAGLPDTGIEYLADKLEPYADNTFRLPVRFLVPTTNTLNITVSGMQKVERGKGTSFVSSFASNFQRRLDPLKLVVKSLPTENQPRHFEGAIGTSFQIRQKIEPDHVHPGDLVKATYELTYDGYMPSNYWPYVEGFTKEFKVYELKEVERTQNRAVWTQVFVPRTTAATNTAAVSITFYNPRLERYEINCAMPKKLFFISDKAASTANTSVMIDEAQTDQTPQNTTNNTALILRFAPSAQSPIIATLPASEPFEILTKVKNWQRIKTPRAIGWKQGN